MNAKSGGPPRQQRVAPLSNRDEDIITAVTIVGEIEAGRYHADDGVIAPVQRHRLPENVARSAEPSLPQARIQEHNWSCSNRIFTRLEAAAEHRFHAKDFEEIR